MPSESEDDPIPALKQGQLNIHCQRMELVQNISDQPGRYLGNGYIRQNDDRGIEFTLYATEITDAATAFRDLLLSPMAGQAGTLFREEESYTLTATSYRGHTWRADRILNLNCQWGGLRSATPRLYGNVDFLKHETKAVVRDTAHRMMMHFFDVISIPCPTKMAATSATFDGAIFDAADNKHFSITNLGDEIVIDVTSEVPLPFYFDLRVVEALSYVLARSMSWTALTTFSGENAVLYLASPRRQSGAPQLGRPLLASKLEELPMVWRLFGKYLEYVMSGNQTALWHKCSSYLGYAREASANSLEAWTIGLCVAVEKLSGLVDYVEPSADREQRLAVQRLVRRWLKSKGWSTTTVGHRANGLLGTLKIPRLKDRLDALVKSGHVDPAHIKIWSKLRHPSVHADERSITDIAAAATINSRQEVFDDIGAVAVLMYHITFYLIGYTEYYTDYSTHNWPSARYPLIASAGGG